MEAIFELQRGLYMNALHALDTMGKVGLAGLPALVLVAFGFGMLAASSPWCRPL